MAFSAKATGFHIKYDFSIGERFEDMCVRLHTTYTRINHKKRKLNMLQQSEEESNMEEAIKIVKLNSNFPYNTKEEFEIGMAAMQQEYLRTLPDDFCTMFIINCFNFHDCFKFLYPLI